MLKIKTPPLHKFNVFIELASNIKPEWQLGKLDDKGNNILTEVECEIDGEIQAIIELHDYKKVTFDQLSLVRFDLKLAYGFDSDFFKKTLLQKYKGKITAKTEIAIILYKLIETV